LFTLEIRRYVPTASDSYLQQASFLSLGLPPPREWPALRFDNPGWVPKEGSTLDPNGSAAITGTSDAQREAVNNLLAVLAELDELTRQAVVGSIAKAYPNPNGITAPNGQRFSSRR
jgi:hypothetical protein